MLQIGAAEAEISAGVIGVEFDRLPQFLDAGCLHPLLKQDHPKVLVRGGFLGVNGDGIAEALRGLIQAPLVDQQEAEIIAGQLRLRFRASVVR